MLFIRKLISLSDFQTGIGVTAHTSQDTEELFTHTRTALVETTAFLQGSDGEVITASELYELLTKIHDILDNSVSKLVFNAAHILAYLFTSASGQFDEVCTSVFLLHNFKDTVPFSEDFLYGY